MNALNDPQALLLGRLAAGLSGFLIVLFRRAGEVQETIGLAPSISTTLLSSEQKVEILYAVTSDSD